jgi:D-alanine-D-alanine ligase
MRITVLMGGANSERDVSLASGTEVANALRRAGHEVATADTAASVGSEEPDSLFQTRPTGETPAIRMDPPEIEELRELRAARSGRVFAEGVMELCAAADLVVVLVYGDEGESGHVQSVLDWVGIPFAGPDPVSCAVTFDKDLTKRLCREAGVPTADWRLLGDQAADTAAAEIDLPGPWVVKPVRGGSTIGTSLAQDREELVASIRAAEEYDHEVLIETYLAGRELSVGFLGDEPLPPIEIRTGDGIFDYVAKYQADRVEEICPAPISDEEREQAVETARAACLAVRLAPETFPRVDLRRDDRGTYHLLEINPLPGMTPTSLYPQCAAAADLDLPRLCDEIVHQAAA